MKGLPERFRRRLVKALGATQPPGRIAAAWAVGVGIGLSPLLGAHTAIALAVAVVFRLNKVDVLLGTLIINPWTLTVYFPAAVLLGKRVTGLAVPRIVLPQWSQLLDPAVWRQQEAWLKPLMISWWTGAAMVAATGGLATYFIIRSLVTRHRAHHRTASRSDDGEQPAP